jgi:hypothetical protein
MLLVPAPPPGSGTNACRRRKAGVPGAPRNACEGAAWRGAVRVRCGTWAFAGDWRAVQLYCVRSREMMGNDGARFSLGWLSPGAGLDRRIGALGCRSWTKAVSRITGVMVESRRHVFKCRRRVSRAAEGRCQCLQVQQRGSQSIVVHGRCFGCVYVCDSAAIAWFGFDCMYSSDIVECMCVCK